MCPVGARCTRSFDVGCPVIAETRILGRKPRWVALWVALLMLFAAWGSAWARCQNTSLYTRDVCIATNEPCCLKESAFGNPICEVSCEETFINGSLHCVVTHLFQ